MHRQGLPGVYRPDDSGFKKTAVRPRLADAGCMNPHGVADGMKVWRPALTKEEQDEGEKKATAEMAVACVLKRSNELFPTRWVPSRDQTVLCAHPTRAQKSLQTVRILCTGKVNTSGKLACPDLIQDVDESA